MKNSVLRQCDDPIRPLGSAKKEPRSKPFIYRGSEMENELDSAPDPLPLAPTAAATACRVSSAPSTLHQPELKSPFSIIS